MTAQKSAPGEALWRAVRNNDVKVVEELLQNGVDLEAKNATTRQTMLGIAAHYGRTEVVRLLLDRGANANTQAGEYEVTPLHEAATEGHTETARLLIEGGAKVDAANSSGSTPLMYAINGMGKTHAYIRLLIDNGADVSLRNKDGDTALSFAEERGDEGLVTLLKEAYKLQCRRAEEAEAIRASFIVCTKKQQRLNAARNPIILRRPQA